MVKQLLDLSKEESESLDKISKHWKMNKTDAVKKMIREYAKQFDKNHDDLFRVDFDTTGGFG